MQGEKESEGRNREGVVSSEDEFNHRDTKSTEMKAGRI
jgi:hypothetical protein